MRDLLDKLSSYNLFNYLLPGTIFVAAAQRISTHTFKDENIVVQLFLYYFIGMVISRIGSLTIEPTLKKLKVVEFAEYKDFIKACKTDAKIDVLSEQNNTYRTLCAVFISLGILKAYDLAVAWQPPTTNAAVLVGLFLLFVFAYRKQTRYIRDRVGAAIVRD
jgi:hypothetical protein